MGNCGISATTPFVLDPSGSCQIAVSDKHTPLDKKALGKTSFQSTNSGAGEQFLPPDCRAKACQKEFFFSDAGIVFCPSSWVCETGISLLRLQTSSNSSPQSEWFQSGLKFLCGTSCHPPTKVEFSLGGVGGVRAPPPVLGRGDSTALESNSQVVLYASACCRRVGEAVWRSIALWVLPHKTITLLLMIKQACTTEAPAG